MSPEILRRAERWQAYITLLAKPDRADLRSTTDRSRGHVVTQVGEPGRFELFWRGYAHAYVAHTLSRRGRGSLDGWKPARLLPRPFATAVGQR